MLHAFHSIIVLWYLQVYEISVLPEEKKKCANDV